MAAEEVPPPPEFIPITEMFPALGNAVQTTRENYKQCIAANVSNYVYTPDINDFDVIIGKYRSYIYSEPGNNIPELRALKEVIYYYALQNVLLDFIERLRTEGALKYDLVLRGTYGLRNLPEMESKKHLLPTSDIDIVLYPKEGISEYDAHEQFIQGANYIFGMYCELIVSKSINTYIDYIYRELAKLYYERFSGNMTGFYEFGNVIHHMKSINKIIQVSKPERSPINNLYKFIVREILPGASYTYALMDIVVYPDNTTKQRTENVNIYVSPQLTTTQEVPTVNEYINEKKKLYCDLGCESDVITNPSYCDGLDVGTYKYNANDWKKEHLCGKFEKQLSVIDESNITVRGGKRTRRMRKKHQNKSKKNKSKNKSKK